MSDQEFHNEEELMATGDSEEEGDEEYITPNKVSCE